MKPVMDTSAWLDELRLPDNYTKVVSGIKLPLKPSFGKLNRHRFSRVHPHADYKIPVLLVEDKELGEAYIASYNVASYLGTAATPKILRLAVDNAGVPKIVAQPIQDVSGRLNLWTQTAIQAISLAEREWIRVEADMSAQQYTIIQAANDLGEPRWPNEPMDVLVKEVFQGNVINTPEHPFIRQREGRF